MPINAIYDGANSISSGTAQWVNGNGISFGINGQTVTGSVLTNYLTAVQIQDSINSNNVTGVMFSNSNNITFGLNSNTLTASFSPPKMVSFENIVPFASQVAETLNGASISHAVAFFLPVGVNASYVRVPVSMTTASTTLATTAASLSASVALYSTWNAVVYSLETGVNSQILASVASGSVGFTFMNSVSYGADGTSGSYSQFYTCAALGAITSQSTQYTVANTNMSFTTNQIATAWSGLRFLDINFNNTLSEGNYWLVFGYSSSSATNSTGVSAASNCGVRYSNHYGVSQPNLAFGVLGNTNMTSGGGGLGAGSYSQVGGGTTGIIQISAISSSASNLRHYFQILGYS